MKDDHYKTLSLSRHASTSEIRSRYKSLAKRYHPDRMGDTEMMARINSAYTVLKDPRLRFQYNRQARGAGIGSDNPAMADTAAPIKRPPLDPPPKLKFQPFRSVSFVAILILTFAILGVFGYVHEAAAPGDANLGTTSSSSAPPKATTAVQAPSSGVTHAVQDGKNLFSRAEQDIHSGAATITDCNNQRRKDLQAVQATQQQIRLTQAQLAENGQYTEHGGFLHPSSVSSQYDQLRQQLDQQLQQYHADMAALGATGDRCS